MRKRGFQVPKSRREMEVWVTICFEAAAPGHESHFISLNDLKLHVFLIAHRKPLFSVFVS